jgi:hypothetical protein
MAANFAGYARERNPNEARRFHAGIHDRPIATRSMTIVPSARLIVDIGVLRVPIGPEGLIRNDV